MKVEKCLRVCVRIVERLRDRLSGRETNSGWQAPLYADAPVLGVEWIERPTGIEGSGVD
jgi:hypothetical protein